MKRQQKSRVQLCSSSQSDQFPTSVLVTSSGLLKLSLQKLHFYVWKPENSRCGKAKIYYLLLY